ncbi:putative reverse transcriptase domain-containing protein [Tanacetum coccineum]
MTPESIQAMIDQALLRNSTNGDESHSSHGDNRRNVQTTRPCFYADFMKCQPLNFKGNEGVVGLTRWIEKMESVFHISGCAIENQVKFATCTLLGAALTWLDMVDKNLRSDAYSMDLGSTQEENGGTKVNKYISGLPDNIYGNVKSSRPKTLDETIELANDLMDQKLRTYAERQTDNKRKADDSSRNNHGHQQQPFKRQNVAKVYNMGAGEKKPYGGSLPKCTKCHFHHNGPCTQKCHKCNKAFIFMRGHFARDCRGSGNTNVANAQRDNRAVPKGNGCFECGAPGHFKRDCPKLKNKDGEMGMHKAGYTQLEMQRRMGMHRGTQTPMSSRAQEYMAKGCRIFLAHISAKKEEDKSEGKQLKDDKKEHEEHLKAILELLKKEKLYAKFSKCEFWISKYNFLVLWLISRFIEGFLKIAKSITKLTQKGIKFDWGEKEENAFQLIKQKLCSAPILALPKGSEDFVVYCDASHKGLGAVLMQEETGID